MGKDIYLVTRTHTLGMPGSIHRAFESLVEAERHVQKERNLDWKSETGPGAIVYGCNWEIRPLRLGLYGDGS